MVLAGATSSYQPEATEPRIDRALPLSAIGDGLPRVESGDLLGKMVIEI